jgi:hypothetical protein
MYTKADVMSAWTILGAALVTCTLFAGNVAATDQEFTVAYRVSTQGLDLSQPATRARRLHIYWALRIWLRGWHEVERPPRRTGSTDIDG